VQPAAALSARSRAVSAASTGREGKRFAHHIFCHDLALLTIKHEQAFHGSEQAEDLTTEVGLAQRIIMLEKTCSGRNEKYDLTSGINIHLASVIADRCVSVFEDRREIGCLETPHLAQTVRTWGL